MCVCVFHISVDPQPLDIEYKIHYHLYILIMQMRRAGSAGLAPDLQGKANFIAGDYNLSSRVTLIVTR